MAFIVHRASDDILNDPSLSFTALGIWAYLFCQPKFELTGLPSGEEIIALGRGTPDEILNALHDLQLRGFIELEA